MYLYDYKNFTTPRDWNQGGKQAKHRRLCRVLIDLATMAKLVTGRRLLRKWEQVCLEPKDKQ